MNAAKTVTVIAVVLGAAGLAKGQPAVLNTLPTEGGQSFNPEATRVVRGPGSAAGPQVATGHLFTAQASGEVHRILTAIRHIDGDNSYTVQIRLGNASNIGAVVGEWAVQGSGGPYPFLSYWTGGSAPLNAGQTYWVTLIGHGSAHGAWHLNTQGVGGEWSQSTNGGATFLLVNGSQLPAIRLEPEGYPSCSADWNRDGVVNSGDITAYLSTWIYSVANGTHEADFNGCGCVNSGQIAAFLTAWFQQVEGSGC